MALQNIDANILLDLYNHDTTPTTVKAIQLDSQTRYVAALLQNGGAQYDIDSGATVQLIVVRPDNVGVQITGTTFEYGEEGAQFLGPYAELTQVALAVSGKMRGQFKITSGTQILRTEIFAINNGVALDASTDEWADEYDGYNLDELVADVAEAVEKVGDLETDVAQIKEDLNNINVLANGVIENEITETDVLRKTAEDAFPSDVSVTNGYMRNMSLSSPGSLTGTSSDVNKTISYVAPRDMDVYVTFARGSGKQVCIFDGQPYGSSYRVTPVYATNTPDYPLPTKDNPVHVKEGQYITFSYYNGGSDISNMTFAIVEVTVAGSALKASLPLTSEMEGQVDDKIESARNILNGGYYHLDTDKFARHGWNNSTTADNRNYRVRYTEPLTFDTTVYGVLKEGYTIAGFEDGTFFDSRSVKTFFPNAEYKIYVRRFTEDSSEIADINEFANALKLSTGIAPIELYSPTFADVSMFERVGVCGDSYAAGGGIISGVRPLTWGKNLERQAGITVDIYAKSGQNVMQWNVDATNGLPALLNGAECGLYWMQHGINGTSTAEQFGTLEDITTYPHPNTFCGQYTEAVEQIRTAFPNARIILATIIGSGFSLYQSQYSAVNNAIKAIATHCGVMLVDVADDDFYRSPYYPTWIRSNHPTAMQCAGIAMANRRLISKCIQENGDYFVNYGAN